MVENCQPPSPARIQRVIEIDSPRAPGARFEPEFARLRYEILAALGEPNEKELQP